MPVDHWDDMPLYQRILGPDYQRLPAVTRLLHDVRSQVSATGHATVTHGTSRFARVLTRLLGFPRPAVNVPLTVTIEATKGGETLSRRYPDATLTTEQRQGSGADAGFLLERLGPVVLVLALKARDDGLDFILERTRIFGWTLPRQLWPLLTARERVLGDRHSFSVSIGLPGIGRLIRYEGLLSVHGTMPEPEPDGSRWG